MSNETTLFQLPEDVSVHQVRDSLASVGIVDAEPPALFERVYYDTFDWRLYRAGLILEEAGSQWRISRYDDGETVGAFVSENAVCFASEIPKEDLRAELAPLLEMRALLPLVRVRGVRQVWMIRDQAGKAAVRVSCEEATAFPPSAGDAQPLPAVVALQAYDGDSRQLAAIQTHLENELSLQPATALPWLMAVTAAGREPGDYSPGFRLQLERSMRADEALTGILATLLEAMRRNEAGVLADLDTEFLHDFRVAVRRTRSALAQIKNVLPPEKVDHYRTEFAWLGTLTTPTRDLDVYLLQFDELSAGLPSIYREHLEPLRDYLERRRAAAQTTLVNGLNSARYQQLVDDLTTFLAEPVPVKPTATRALRPAPALAQKQIWQAARRTRKEALAITAESRAEEVHDLRKTAKKLRYLIEFFQSYYPSDQLKQVVAELKRLQDVLGEFQDRQVQLDILNDFAKEMSGTEAYSAETEAAVDAFAQHLLELEEAAREALPRRIQEFTRPAVRSLLRELFKPGSGEAPR